MSDKKPIAAGKSSFDLVDPYLFLEIIQPLKGQVICDLACGTGRYAMAIYDKMENQGTLYAVDLWKDGIDNLREVIEEREISGIIPLQEDITRPLTIPEATVDLCLMATVIHDLKQENTHGTALGEAARLVKSGGRLAVVEFNKVDSSPGPPKEIRISPQELKNIIEPHGFNEQFSMELSPQTYVSIFNRTV